MVLGFAFGFGAALVLCIFLLVFNLKAKPTRIQYHVPYDDLLRALDDGTVVSLTIGPTALVGGNWGRWSERCRSRPRIRIGERPTGKQGRTRRLQATAAHGGVR